MRIRTYSDLQQLRTFEERFDYLSLDGVVGFPTFGHERFLNQRFYTSTQWRHLRSEIIARDLGNDLGVPGHEIYDKIIIHHMNPMTPRDVYESNPEILNPEFLVVTRHSTHNAIHFGDRSLILSGFVERRPGDTKLW